MSKVNTHYCKVKIDSFGLPKLPPNAPWYLKVCRKIMKNLTLNPNSADSKRFFRNKSMMLHEQKRHLQGHNYVIHPFSTVNRIRKMLFCIMWIIDMFVSPLYMSLIQVATKNTNGQLLQRDRVFFTFYMYLFCPLQAIIVAMYFITGYANYKTKEIVIEPTKIVKSYLNFYYIVDFITCLKLGVYSTTTEALYFLNMACMFRLNTVFVYMKDMMLNFQMSDEVFDCIKLFVTTLIILHVWTCFFYYIPWIVYIEDFDVNSWAAKNGLLPVDTNSIGMAYVECLLSILCHFFGTGQGPHVVDPVNYLEQLLLALVMITGRIWTLNVIACVLKLFSVVTMSESKYEEYLLQLEVFMRQKRLPQPLRNRLVEYYSYTYQNHFFNEEAIFDTLSAYLREEMLLYSARRLISKVELLKILPRSVVNTIITSTRKVVYLANDAIVKAGDPIDFIYFISSGTVALTLRNGAELSHLEDGDQIGLMGVLSNRDFYKYNYFAIETTEVYIIGKKEFKALVQEHSQAVNYFHRKLMELDEVWMERELSVNVTEHDILSDLTIGKLLERPVKRPVHFEN